MSPSGLTPINQFSIRNFHKIVLDDSNDSTVAFSELKRQMHMRWCDNRF